MCALYGADVEVIMRTMCFSKLEPFLFILAYLAIGCQRTPDAVGEQEDRRAELTSALISAVGSGNQEEIRSLLAKGADVNSKRWSILHTAAVGSSPEIVLLLLAGGAEVDFEDKDGDTPLHAAIRKRREDVARVLIDAKANVNARNQEGQTPLSLAIAEGLDRTAQLLVRAGASITLHEAAYVGDTEAVREFMRSGSDVNEKGLNGYTSLHAASLGGHEVLLELLIAGGADVHAKDDDGRTALHLAVRRGHIGAASLLIAKGASLETRCKWGRTPLFHANNVAMVELLLAKGADVNATDNNGDTPLYWATLVDSPKEVVDFLVERGADIQPGNLGRNQRLLLYAAKQGLLELATRLLDGGTDVDSRDSFRSGMTALLMAICHEQREMAKLLIAKGQT